MGFRHEPIRVIFAVSLTTISLATSSASGAETHQFDLVRPAPEATVTAPLRLSWGVTSYTCQTGEELPDTLRVSREPPVLDADGALSGRQLVLDVTFDEETENVDGVAFTPRHPGRYTWQVGLLCSSVGGVALWSPARSFNVRIRPLPIALSKRGRLTRLGGPRGTWENLESMTDRFGEPDWARPVSTYGCDARWSGLGMSVSFANYGSAPGPTLCDTPELAYTQGGRISGAQGKRYFRANRLRIGDRAQRIRSVYRHARKQGQSWLLRPYLSRIATPHVASELVAETRGGRITAFAFSPGLAGE